MTNSTGVGRTEQIGATIPPPPLTVSGDPTVSALSSQVVQLTAMVSEMRSRMDSPSEPLWFGRPPPAPPFSVPLSSTTASTFPMFTFTPTPTVATHTPTHSLPPFSAGFSQTLGLSQPIPIPQFGFHDAGGTGPLTSRFSQQPSQPWQFSHHDRRSADRFPLSRPQMVSASSCWGPPGPTTTFGTFLPEQQRPKVKLEPPRFDGTEVNNWIRGIQFYFDHIGTPEAQRLHYVIMLFEPGVADWIWNYQSSHEFVTWQEFLDDVRRRFDPQCYVSPVGLLKKLQQTGTVYDYQLAFEKLQTKIVGVPDHVLLDLYVAGLKQPIQDEVLLHRPASLAAAFALATQLASCRQEAPPPQSNFSRRQWQPRDSRAHSASQPPSAASQASPAPAPRASFSTPRPQENSTTPIIRLSAAEKAERRRLNLCFYCPEKWVAGHVCTHRFLAYMGVGEDEDDPVDIQEEPIPEEVIAADLSHLLAMEGQRKSKSLTLSGTIDSEAVEVLIDTGSSHDFLHPRIAEKLHLPLTSIRPFRVYVGNGSSLLCSHLCKATRLTMQGTPFSIDLHVLPIHGPDVILGMEWLESLGRVTTDFVAKSMEFVKDNQLVVLSGALGPPSLLSLNSFASLMSHSSVFELYELVQSPPTEKADASPPEFEFPADLPAAIRAVLDRHREVFELPTGLPPARQFDHRIHLLPNIKPVNVRPYRYPYFQKNEIERQVKEMLDQGVIQRSHSPFSSPVLLVRKKDGTFRFCIDYRALNKATVPDHFPIPTADELFDELGPARFFTKLDLRSGYHQIRMHESDTYKTAFRTHDGHFEFLVMPFGLTNAPSTFQSAMNCIFQPFLRKFVIVFFDDILVYSPTLESHGSHLDQVLFTLVTHQFFVKLSKCSFCSMTVDYLGHLVSEGQLKADPAKIEAMVDWPIPTSVRQLRGFLGLTGYYRRFIAHYAVIAAPLTDLLKKDAFSWSSAAADSFGELKQAMTAAPVLHLPDFSQPFYLETDASDFGIGAVLMQNGHPLAFFSKKLGPRRRSASTYHKELYAIVEAVQKWRQYLLGREFVIRSDQKSLRELLQQVIQTPEQHLYVRKLMGYKFTIEYKAGAANKVADALSRRDEEADETAALLTALAHPIPELLHLLREETATSKELCALRDQIAAGNADPKFSVSEGLIFCGRRIMVSSDSPLRETLLQEHHSTPLAGHPGFERTLRRLTAAFYWPHMRRDVKAFVASCVTCQTTKYSTQKPAGLLQPLPIPTQVWEDVSMDFVVGLPSSRGYTSIMVAVDRLSKYAHFAPLPARFDALRVARLFIDTVVKHHGFPKTLVSDRDPIFLSDVWKDMLRLSGTTLHFSTAYHPQSDGQTEVRNRGLEQYLRAFVADRPSKWTTFLPWAELALNCFHNEGIGTSPFRALYGREPPPLVAVQPSAGRIRHEPAVAELIEQRAALLVELRRNLERAQQRMRASANKHRRDVQFEVGDKVFLKLQNYRQHSVARPLSAKLAKRFYGPFTVTERVGPVAYRLQLPQGSRIHDVFHVSLLRPYVEGSSSSKVVELPEDFVGVQSVVRPVRIVDRRVALSGGQPVEQALVQWSGEDASLASWEPLEMIAARFPSLLEDKESLNGEGVDTDTSLQPTVMTPVAGDTTVTSERLEVEDSVESGSEEEREGPRRSQRQANKPAWFKDFVSH